MTLEEEEEAGRITKVLIRYGKTFQPAQPEQQED